MSDAEANFTADEQAAFDRVIATFGPHITVGELEPRGPDNPPPKPKVFQEADQTLEDDPDERFRLVPLDFPTLLADGIPEPDYLDAPYLLRGARVWAFGPAESCKTLYFEWVAAHLTRQGKTVVFISAENPLSTDVDRIGRLRPDFERLRFYHRLRRAVHGRRAAIVACGYVYTGGHREMTDDVVAEAFVRTLERGDSVRDRASYVYRVAFRLAASELRRPATVAEVPEHGLMSINEDSHALFTALRQLGLPANAFRDVARTRL
jgi:hypothetical protein